MWDNSELESVFSSLSLHRERRKNIQDAPADIIILIFQNLPLVDQYTLLQVCSSFRAVLREPFQRSTRWLHPIEDRIEYLAARARLSLDHWVCERCASLHRHHLGDAPTTPMGCENIRPFVVSSQFELPGYVLSHRHVQLALKYFRLRSITGQYAASFLRLMTAHQEHRTECPSHELFGVLYPGSGYHWCEPKIAETEGRFLLYQGLAFTPNAQGDWQREDIMAVRLCQHRIWFPSALRRIEQLRSIVNIGGVELLLLNQLQWIEGNELQQAFVRLIQYGGSGFELSCPHCSSDCRVQVFMGSNGTKRIEVHAWHDFGPEGSPLDDHWLAKQFPGGLGYDAPRSSVQPGNAVRLWQKYRKSAII
ncbi:hypothetical protein PWT90_02303 [Aphanocladium album]|nr:hypothetical protein PWT90_02303 [Aphanocladium album]